MAQIVGYSIILFYICKAKGTYVPEFDAKLQNKN